MRNLGMGREGGVDVMTMRSFFASETCGGRKGGTSEILSGVEGEARRWVERTSSWGGYWLIFENFGEISRRTGGEF